MIENVNGHSRMDRRTDEIRVRDRAAAEVRVRSRKLMVWDQFGNSAAVSMEAASMDAVSIVNVLGGGKSEP